MSDYRIPVIIDCDCGLRYMRRGEQLEAAEAGHFRCTCGKVIGAWDGLYRLDFEPEDADPNW